MIPGEIIFKKEDIVGNEGRQTITLEVENSDKRPIAVGSHMHFFEVNKFMKFDREKAFGYKLDIPSGTVIRWEPGDKKTVTLIPFGGRQVIRGLNNLTNGQVTDFNKGQALLNAKLKGFMD